MNKTDLIGKLAERLDGDRKAAQVAVEGVIDLIQRTVHGGDTVSISGFGVFEKRARAARTARNPRTGTAVKVKKTVIPAFRPGKYFKDVIAGSVKLPKTVGGAPLTARAAAAAAKTSATRSTAPKAAPATKAAPAEKAAPKTTRAAASKTAATKTPAKAAPAAKAPAAAAAAKGTATKTAAKPAAAARTAAPKTAAKATAAPKASAAAAKSPAPKAPARRAAAAKS